MADNPPSSSPPPDVLRYVACVEHMRKLKVHYDTERQKMQSTITTLKSRVMEWMLSSSDNHEIDVEPQSDKQIDILGARGRLCYKARDEPRALTHSRLDEITKVFFAQHVRKMHPSIPDSALEKLALLCTDFVWQNRELVHKQEIKRVYGERKRKRRRLEEVVAEAL